MLGVTSVPAPFPGTLLGTTIAAVAPARPRRPSARPASGWTG